MPTLPRIVTNNAHSPFSYHKAVKHYIEKIPITIDDEQLSAIVLHEDVFHFVKDRKINSEEGLPIVDALGLIALKAHAYSQNLALTKQGKINSKNDYNKHRSDILRLLLSLEGSESPVVMPGILKQSCLSFLGVLKDSARVLKTIPYHTVPLNALVSLYERLFC